MCNRHAIQVALIALMIAGCARGPNISSTTAIAIPTATVTNQASSQAAATDRNNSTGQATTLFTPTPKLIEPDQGYPPLLPTSATNEVAYPMPTPVPTVEPAMATAAEQTKIAASTATRAALRLTLTAEASRPTNTPEPTQTPAPNRTTPIATSTPECAASGEYSACHDALLGMSFEYPAAWGAVTAWYSAGETGFAYHYFFQGSERGLQAGGRSRDHSEGREWSLTDFNGSGSFSTKMVPRFGTNLQVVTQSVQANVEFVALFPQAEELCVPGFGLIFEPIGFIAITFPATAAINGFTFTSEFLSDETWESLAGILGFLTQAQDANCKDAELRLKFDERVQEIIDSILGGSVDSETQANIDRLLHLGQSIQLD